MFEKKIYGSTAKIILSEIVEPGLLGNNIDYQTMSQTPILHAQALLAMQWMREDEAFYLMDYLYF